MSKIIDREVREGVRSTPVVILAGVDYTGIPVADVIAHVRAVVAEQSER